MTPQPQQEPFLHEGKTHWECPMGYNCDTCPNFSGCRSIPPCAKVSRPAPSAQERIGSIRTNVFMDKNKEWLIERVNAGMGEWDYVISYLGEYFATAPSELIAREIQEAYSDRATIRNQTLDTILNDLSQRSCVGRAIEKIEDERGKDWLREQLMESLRRSPEAQQ